MKTTAVSLLLILGAAGAAPAGLRWEPLREPGCGGWMTGLSVSPHDSRRLLVGGDMLGAALSEDRGDSWQAATGFVAWEMADFIWHPADPRIAWAGSMSGPYRSADGGRTWTLRRGGMPPMAQGAGYATPVETVLFDPGTPGRLLAFGGNNRGWHSLGEPRWGVVWESTDDGGSWRRLTTLTAGGSADAPDAAGLNITQAAFAPGAPGRLYALTRGGGFFRSDDGGRTWTPRNRGLPQGAELGQLAVHPAQPDILWLAVGNSLPPGAEQRLPGGVFKSADGGLSWTDSSRGILRRVTGKDGDLTTRVAALAVARTQPETLFCNDGAWNTGVIYRSRDGGATWLPVATKGNIGQDDFPELPREGVAILRTAYPAGLSLTRLTIDPNNAKAIFGFGSEFIARSLDGGTTWDDATATEAGEGRWRGRGYSGLCCTSFNFNPFRAGQAIAQAMDAAQAWISDDNLQSWSHHHSPHTPWSGGTDAAFARDGRIYVATGPHGWMGIGRSDDGGRTWTWLDGESRGLPAAPGWGRDRPGAIHAHPERSERAWVVIEGNLLATTDAGANWRAVPEIHEAGWIADRPGTPDTLFVSTARGAFRSTDAGASFHPIGGPANAGRITADHRGRLLLAAHQGERPGVWRWEEEGRWSRLLDETWVYGVAVDPTDADRILISTSQDPYIDRSLATGVWISADGGASWRQENDGLAMLRGRCVAIDPHDPERIVFGAFGRGFFIARWPRDYRPEGTRRYRQTDADAEHARIKPPEPVLVRNGDMTAGDTVPAEWTGVWGEAEAARDTEVFRSPPASLRVTVAEAGREGRAFQSFALPGTRTFTLSGALRTRGEARVNVAVQAFAADWSRTEFLQTAFAQGDTEWTVFRRAVTLPSWTGQFQVLLLVEGRGTAWLDDVVASQPATAP